MFIYDIIEKKRLNKALTKEEIDWVVDGYLKDKITDAQMSALLMAITINGMTDKETYYLTKAMQASGKTYKFDFTSVDKHSTGGVGDDTTFVLVPTLASLGLKVTKMSGKSLGFTGGTIDKLACFDGYNPLVSEKEFLSNIDKCGCALISQSDRIALADRKIYALRDATATVDSIPLIASSIMSKKLASGADVILLDVKCGTGAFMKTIQDARKLAHLMVNIGKSDGKVIAATITNMNVPLAHGVGCCQEIYCAIKALEGENSTLLELSKYLSAKLYSLATHTSFAKAKQLVNDAINSGRALNKLKEMVSLAGGDTSVFDNPDKLLASDYVVQVTAHTNGYINNIDAYKVAKFVNHLKDVAQTDKQKRRTGIIFEKFLGDKVSDNDVIAKIYSSSNIGNKEIDELIDCFEFDSKLNTNYKLVLEAIK